MRYEMNFGKLTVARSQRGGRKDGVFRLAVLGDFSARANKGEVQVGSELAKRRPLRVDVDNLDATIRRLAPRVRFPLTPGGDLVEIEVEGIDDFHPDQLHDKLDLFSELADLRRRLKNNSTFREAAREVREWLPEEPPEPSVNVRSKSGANVMPRGKMSDFARLLGRGRAATPASASTAELIRQVVAPHIVPASDPGQEALVESVDQALSSTMRDLLHHPDFQALEALWRSVDMLTRQLETDTHLQIILYDMTAEEIAADLSRTDDLAKTGIYRLFVEEPVHEQQGALSALVGNYLFEKTPPHAELLGRIAKIAAAAGAPFIAGITTECLDEKSTLEVHPLIVETWTTLHDMPHARYLGLTVPRFLLRWPYGAKTEPIEPFSFEEFTPRSGLQGMLWGNGAVLAGLLLGQTFTRQGLSAMQLGSVMSIGDMPFYYYTDEYGDQIALPCTERVITEQRAARLLSGGLMPVLSFRGRPEVRLGGFVSLGGETLAGPWNPIEIAEQSGSAVKDVAVAKPVAETSEAAARTMPAADSDDVAAGDEPAVAHADTHDQGASVAVGSEHGGSSPGGMDELDALLAELDNKEKASASPSEGEMDPELKALLDSL